MGSQTSVLLVGHDASRTGAPTAGLAWLRWARSHDRSDVAVTLADGGPLLEQYRLQASTRVVDHRLAAAAAGSWSTALPELLARPGRGTAAVLSRVTHPRARDPIVVANTSAAWALAATVRNRKRLVLWLHELDHTVERIMSAEQRDRLLRETDHIVAVGPAVAAMVTDRWKVPTDRVSMVPSFIDAPAPTDLQATGQHDLVAVGSLSARKAPDVFVAVAAQVGRLRGHVEAAWVGGPLDGPTATMVRRDVEDSLLDPPVELVGEVEDTSPWLPRSGVVVHVAREDPAPLSVLEAARHGVPVVTWAGSGAAELAVEAGRPDLTVASGDVAAMARVAASLLDDPDERDRAGRALAEAATHRTTRAVAPRLQAAIIGTTP